MPEAISEAEREAFARDAFAAIEAVLDRRCPEMKNAYWAAVDLLYRLDSRPGRQLGPATRPGLQVPSLAQPPSGLP